MLSTLLVFIWFFVTCHGLNQQENNLKSAIKSMPEAEKDAFIESMTNILNSSTSIPSNYTTPSSRRLEEVTGVIDPKMDNYKEEVNKIFPVMAEKAKKVTFSRRDDDRSDDEDRSGARSSADDNLSENDNQDRKSSERNGDVEDDNNDQDTDGNEQENKDSDVEGNAKEISFKDDDVDDDEKNKSIDDEDNLWEGGNTKKISNKKPKILKLRKSKNFKDFTYRSPSKSNTVKDKRRTGHNKINNSTTVHANKSHVMEKRSKSEPQKNLQPDNSQIVKIQLHTPTTEENDTNVSTISQDTATSTTESKNVTISVERVTSKLNLNNTETDFLDQINQNKTFPLAFLDSEKLLKTTSVNDHTSTSFTKMNDLIGVTTKMGTSDHSATVRNSTEKNYDKDQTTKNLLSVDTKKPALEQFDETADDFLTASTLASSNETMNSNNKTSSLTPKIDDFNSATISSIIPTVDYVSKGLPSPTVKQSTETIDNKKKPIASTTAQTKQEHAQEDIQFNLRPETTTLHPDGEQLSAPESTQIEQPYFIPVHDYAPENAYYNPLNYLGLNIPTKIINIEPKDNDGKKIVSSEKHSATNKFVNLDKSHVPYKIIDNFAGDMKDYLEHSRIAYHKMLEDLKSNNYGKESNYLDDQPAKEDRDEDLAMDYFLKRADYDIEIEDPEIKRQHRKPKSNKPEYELYYKTPKGYISQYSLADVNKAINDQINEDMKDFTKAFNVAPKKDVSFAINNQFVEGTKAFTKVSPSKEVPLENTDLESFIRVMENMITTNDEKLINYDWLATTVDIQGAIEKLISLSDNFDEGLFVHPFDVSILRYTQHLFNDVRPHGPLKSYLKRQVNTLRKGNTVLMLSLRRMHTLPLVHYNKQVSLRKFLVELRKRLFNLHNSMKYIAFVTTYRNQHWFQNLKDLYLTQPTRSQVLEVLLHIFTSRFFSLVDQSAMNGMQEDYIVYLQSEEAEVLRAENELKVVLKIMRKLKSFEY